MRLINIRAGETYYDETNKRYIGRDTVILPKMWPKSELSNIKPGWMNQYRKNKPTITCNNYLYCAENSISLLDMHIGEVVEFPGIMATNIRESFNDILYCQRLMLFDLRRKR